MTKHDSLTEVESGRSLEGVSSPGWRTRLASAIERTNPSPRLAALAIVATGATALVTLYFHDPAAAGFFPPCPFHYLTGLHCPGCGTLRATHQLLHGHPLAALDLNPLMVLSLPFLAYAFLSYFGKTFFNRPLRPQKYTGLSAQSARALTALPKAGPCQAPRDLVK